MCSEDEPKAERHEVTRRKFLHGAGAVALASVVRLPVVLPARAAMAGPNGTLPIGMAMHIHSAFSEQYGSMETHLFQALANAVNVIWWTDHDYRMASLGYRKTVHFTSLTAETGAAGEGPAWQWQRVTAGRLTPASTGGIVSQPSSPLDPVSAGCLALSALSTSQAPATLGFFAESHPADWNYHCSLIGQTVSIEVLPTSISGAAYLELQIVSSFHPARSGRPAGKYVLSYRFGGPGAPGSRTAVGLLGIVTIPVTRSQWNSISLSPMQDIGALWPDLDARDFALFNLNLNAVSSGDIAAGNFDYMRFTRSSGQVQLQAQLDMMAGYGGAYPGVTQRQGLEVSLKSPHVNWFGGTVSLPNYGTITSTAAYQAFLQTTVIPQIHAGGGLASYNHPFGARTVNTYPPATQDQMLVAAAKLLLANRAFGTDIIEVGYPLRNGVDLAHHVGLWDVCSRNALFLTGNGVNDDHNGSGWLTLLNNWFTSVWAPSTSEADLLRALAAGRAWCGSLSRFRGTMDLLVDGTCPMGSASVSSLAMRQLTVVATNLPAGATLQVAQGAVDYAGGSRASPNTRVIASYQAGQLVGDSATLAVDCSISSFVRTQVVDVSHNIVALSNPAWLLREVPSTGIPIPRAC